VTLTSELIDQTRHLLHADTRPERNQLNDIVTSNDTSFTLRYPLKNARTGAGLAVGLEEMHVWQESGQSVTVKRGDNGSPAQDHDAGEDVWVNPRYSGWRIFNAINDELRGLSTVLWRPVTVDLAYQQFGEYALDATDILGIVSVAEDPPSPEVPRNVPWRFHRDLNVLRIDSAVHPASTLRVIYKTGFDTLTALTDNVEDETGLWVEAHDILPVGAAVRCVLGAEVARNYLDQGDTRRAEEVPAGARTQMVRNLALQYQLRVQQEQTRLLSKHEVLLR
jgi:hypothetical protein